MRIIAGKARGRQIEAPEGRNTRPTLDRVRENLFNILQMRIRGASVLDLFAGSGALSLEAISRGAEKAVLCDNDRSANRIQHRNAEALGFSGQTEILLSDWKKAYLSATGNEKIKIKNALIMAYKALGYSETEANETINKWK